LDSSSVHHQEFFSVHTSMVYVIQVFFIRPDPDSKLSANLYDIPLLCVQRKTPDDGQRNCPKHVEFYSKNKFDHMYIHHIHQKTRKTKWFWCLEWQMESVRKTQEGHIRRQPLRWDTMLYSIFSYFSFIFVSTYHSTLPLFFYLLRCKFLSDGNLGRSSLLWDVRQCGLVVGYRRFAKTYRSHLQG
jgi:hypothetical protein